MSDNLQAQIVELEERLRQAMLHSDVAKLDALIAPELLFTNHLGQRISKQMGLFTNAKPTRLTAPKSWTSGVGYLEQQPQLP
jgi:hypothetical protein